MWLLFIGNVLSRAWLDGSFGVSFAQFIYAINPYIWLSVSFNQRSTNDGHDRRNKKQQALLKSTLKSQLLLHQEKLSLSQASMGTLSLPQRLTVNLYNHRAERLH